MPPKSKKKSAVKNGMKLSPLGQFLDILPGVVLEDGEITLPDVSLAELDNFLNALGEQEKVSHEDAHRLLSIIDCKKDNHICRRLAAPLFSAILKVVFHAEECREVTRCLYLMASSIYSAGSLPEKRSQEYERINQISQESLQIVLGHFVNTRNNPRDRQWTGLLLKEFLEIDMDMDSNFFRIAFSPNIHSEIIGDNMISETNAAVRFIGGQVVKTLLAMGASAQQLWSNTDEGVHTEFPDPQLPSSQFHKSFQAYVEKHVDQESDPYLGFGIGVSTTPQTSATVQITSMIYTDMGDLVVFIPARLAMFDQCLEIPLEAIQKITMHESVQNRAAIPGATDLVIQLERESGDSLHLNSQLQDVKEVELQFTSSDDADYLLEELQALRPEIEIIQDAQPSRVLHSLNALEIKPPFVLTRDDSESLKDTYMGYEDERERVIPDSYEPGEFREFDDPAYDFLEENVGNVEANDVDKEYDPNRSSDGNDQVPSETDFPEDLQYQADEGESWIAPEESISDDHPRSASDNENHVMENLPKGLRSPMSVDELSESLRGKSSPLLRDELVQDDGVVTAPKARTSIIQRHPKRQTIAQSGTAQNKPGTQESCETLQEFLSSASLTSPETHDASTPNRNVSDSVAEPRSAQHGIKKITIPLKRPATATSTVSKSKKPKLYALAPKPMLGSAPKLIKPPVNPRDEFDFPSSESESAPVPTTKKGSQAVKTGGHGTVAKPKPVSKPKAVAAKKTPAPKKPKDVLISMAPKPKRSQRKAAESANLKIHDINSDEAAVDKSGRIIQSRAKAKNATTNEATSLTADIPTVQKDEINKVEVPSPVLLSDLPSPQTEHDDQGQLPEELPGTATTKDANTITNNMVTSEEHPSASIENPKQLHKNGAHQLGLLDARIDDLPEPQDQDHVDLDRPVTEVTFGKKSHEDMATTLNSMLEGLPDALSSPTTYRKSRVSPEAALQHKKPIANSKRPSFPPQGSAGCTMPKNQKPMQETLEKCVEEKDTKRLSDAARSETSNTKATPRLIGKKRKNVGDPSTPAKKQHLQAPSDDALPSEKISTGSMDPDTSTGQKISTIRAKSPPMPTRRSPRIQQKLDKARTRATRAKQENSQKLATSPKSATVRGEPLVDDFLSRKPAVIAFGSNGPRNQGFRLAKNNLLINHLEVADDNSKPHEIEPPHIQQNPKQPEAVVNPPKKHRKRENGGVPKQLIVPFTEEDRIIILSDGDDAGDDGLESETDFPKSKTPTVSDNSKSQVSRVDENGSPKALDALINKDCNRIMRGLFSLPSKPLEHSKTAAKSSPIKYQTTHAATRRAVTNTSILSSKPRPVDKGHDEISEVPLPIRVLHRRIEKPPVVADKMKKVLVSDVNDPFTDESILRPPTLLTKKFQNLYVPTSKASRPLSEIAGQRSRLSDEDQTLVEARNKSSCDTSEDSSDSEEDTKVEVSQEMKIDEWRNALKPHYKPVLDTLTRINKELVMRMSREEDAIAMVVDEYQEKGLKLITPLIDEEKKRQESVKNTVREAATKLGGMFENLRANARNVLASIEESPAIQLRKQMEARHKTQKEIMERLMGQVVGK